MQADNKQSYSSSVCKAQLVTIARLSPIWRGNNFGKFSRYTLGGSLVAQTKNGHNDPGTEFEAYGGSFGRRAFEVETGGELGAVDYFVSGNYFDERGWRDLSRTHAYHRSGPIRTIGPTETPPRPHSRALPGRRFVFVSGGLSLGLFRAEKPPPSLLSLRLESA